MDDPSEVLQLLTSLHGRLNAIEERIGTIETTLADLSRQAQQRHAAADKRGPLLDKWLLERASVGVVLAQTTDVVKALHSELHSTLAVIRTEHHLTRRAIALHMNTAELAIEVGGQRSARQTKAGARAVEEVRDGGRLRR